MWKLLLAAPMLFIAFAASADPSVTITNMSCSKVQAAVQANGSVILRWRSKSGMPLYGRYVSDRRFCWSGEIYNLLQRSGGRQVLQRQEVRLEDSQQILTPPGTPANPRRVALPTSLRIHIALG